MKKVLGIAGLLMAVCVLTTILSTNFLQPGNLQNNLRWIGLFGVLSVGVAFVIITGGIDLSIGSTVGLVATVLAMSLTVSFHAMDQSLILSVAPDEKLIQLDDSGGGLMAGDHAIFQRGQSVRKKIYEVAATDENGVRLTSAPESFDPEKKSTSLVKLHRMISVHRKTDEIVIKGEFPQLRSGDKIGPLVKGVIGLQVTDFDIARVQVQGGQTVVQISQYLSELDSAKFDRLKTAEFVRFSERTTPMSVPIAVLLSLVIAGVIGLFHGLSITKLKMQPFVVTLTGWLFYRSAARYIAGDKTQGFGPHYTDFKYLASGKPIYMAFVFMVAGLIAFLWFMRKFIKERSNEHVDASKRLMTIILAATGFVVFVASSSQLWLGAYFEDGAIMLNTGEVANGGGTFSAVGLPEVILLWVGVVIWSPSFMGLVWKGVRESPKRVIAPIVALLIGVGLWFGAVGAISSVEAVANGLDSEILKAKHVFNPHWIAEKMPELLPSWMFMMWWAGLILSMIAMVWLLRAIWSVGREKVGVLFAVFGIGMIMWLVGSSPIPQTRVPMPFLIMLVLAVIAGIFLNRTIFGRYLFALGQNEQASRYSGIKTDRMIIIAYVICSVCAGIGGILFALDLNTVQPAALGNVYELYAIAAAVLGGCSLRGGTGSILGVVVGVAVIRVLFNAINMVEIPTQLEYGILATVIFIGVLADEVLKRIAARRRAAKEADSALLETAASVAEAAGSLRL